MSTSPILVIGPTGKTGRRIVQKLTQGGFAVREGSRRSDPPFDWDQPQTWPAAFAGVKAAYVTFYPDLAVPGAPAAITALTKCAKESGVDRLVLLSGRGEANAQRCEDIVRHSGVGYTLIRASWFNQNFDEGQLLGPVLDGVVAMPAGTVKEPFVDTDDIADVAVAALTDARHSGQLYEVTGPRLLSFDDVAAELSRAIGRNIQYAAISFDQFHAALNEDAGPDVADLLTNLCKEVFDGRNESLGDGVPRALGRPPRDFSEYCRSVAATGIWSMDPSNAAMAAQGGD